MSAIERIDAEPSDSGWIGVYTAPDTRVAVITQQAPNRERALEAAAAWVADAEATRGDGTYAWYPSSRHPGRFEVVHETRLGPVAVPLHPA